MKLCTIFGLFIAAPIYHDIQKCVYGILDYFLFDLMSCQSFRLIYKSVNEKELNKQTKKGWGNQVKTWSNKTWLLFFICKTDFDLFPAGSANHN